MPTTKGTGRALTIEQVVGAPLDQILTHQDARVVDIDLDDDRFFGQAFLKRSGELILAMPKGRDPVERDVAIRMLVAHLHGLEYDKWPAHMQSSNVDELEACLRAAPPPRPGPNAPPGTGRGLTGSCHRPHR
jgi:hypothetical protein